MTDLSETLINEEEGASSPTVYADSRGYWTIARGCCVDARAAGAALPQEALAAADAATLAAAQARAGLITGFSTCNDVRQAVIVSMCFQLGTLADWLHFRAAIASGDYTTAAAEMLASTWATQTSTRAKRAAYMMKTGQWLEHGAPIPDLGD